MRRPAPRSALAERRRAGARVHILDVPHSEEGPDGSVTTVQSAEVTLPRAELERIWTPEYLERLARTYWRFLSRVSLGLLRVLYTEHSREIVLLTRPFVLLRFSAPEYDIRPDSGSVTWRVEGGVLVRRRGRGKGFLRIWVRRHGSDPADPAGEETVTVASEVASFVPRIARFGRGLYRFTQLRIHVLVTNAFLRSLARLDLAPSVVGRLRPAPGAAGAPTEARGAEAARAARAEQAKDAGSP
jgi:hypothetical protein